MLFFERSKCSEAKRFRRKTLRDLLQEYPDSGQEVLGNGTVHMPPELIRQSENYKDLVDKVRKYAEENGLDPGY